MSTGQTRVLVLLGVLLALEAVRQPAIKTFFTGIISSIASSASSVSLPNILTSPNNLTPPSTNNYGNKKGWVNPNSDGSCPSGTSPIRVSGGKLMCQFN